MKHIKTRINTKTRAGNAAVRVAGVSVADLDKALQGDQAMLQKLGSMYREGKMAATLMPAIITVKARWRRLSCQPLLKLSTPKSRMRKTGTLS